MAVNNLPLLHAAAI